MANADVVKTFTIMALALSKSMAEAGRRSMIIGGASLNSLIQDVRSGRENMPIKILLNDTYTSVLVPEYSYRIVLDGKIPLDFSRSGSAFEAAKNIERLQAENAGLRREIGRLLAMLTEQPTRKLLPGDPPNLLDRLFDFSL